MWCALRMTLTACVAVRLRSGRFRSRSAAILLHFQELVPGRLEYSTTLLVRNGEVVDYVNTLYEYDGEEYVWPGPWSTWINGCRPYVEEVRHEYVSVPEEHLAKMPESSSNVMI